MEGLEPDAAGRAKRRPERVLIAIARDGVVKWADAKAAGLSPDVVEHRVATGMLVREARGVYRLVGAPRTGITAERAALAATDGRALGLWSANAAHGISRGVASEKVHVMVELPSQRKRTDWFVPHMTRRIQDDEITTRNGLPVTLPSRTIRDFAAFLPRAPWAEAQIRSYIDEALIQKQLKLGHLRGAIDREQAPQVAARMLLHLRYQEGDDAQQFRSIGEAWLRDLIRRRSLPMPLFNCRAMGGALAEADAYYANVPLIIEFDGFTYHHTRAKHDADRLRDRRALRHGIPTLRITKTDFEHDLPALEDDIERMVTGAVAIRSASMLRPAA